MRLLFRLSLIPGEPRTFDPNRPGDEIAQALAPSLYSALVTLDTDGRLLPDLAESWEVKDGGRTYLFHLRPGVLWHDGRPFGSGDVRFTLERLKAQPSISYEAVRRIARIDTPDPRTVALHLSEPWAPFLSILAWGGTVDAVRPAAEAKGIAVETRLDRTGLVSGDPDRLQQVVWNLLSNAVKFTPPQGRVAVLADEVDGQARLRVTDTGIGIPGAFLPYVFDRFRQADSSTTRRHGGLGLGLSIVRHLVELHGGTVAAESEGEGRGATITVKLPLAANAETTGKEYRHEPEIPYDPPGASASRLRPGGR